MYTYLPFRSYYLHKTENMQCVSLWAWVSSTSLQMCTCTNTFSLLGSSAEEHLSQFHFLVIVRRAAVNTDMQVFHSGYTSSHPPHQQWMSFSLSPHPSKHLPFLDDSQSDWGEVKSQSIFLFEFSMMAKDAECLKRHLLAICTYLRTVCSVHWPIYLLARVLIFFFF